MSHGGHLVKHELFTMDTYVNRGCDTSTHCS